uniref:Uncharacterized protein n=1 Tax=viral metagenome TaxID=1070528 RepID=A0A6M3IEP7_9ZZZZ
MGLLDQSTTNLITKLISGYLGDTSIGAGVSITYKMTGTTVALWSPTTQLIPDMYTNFSGVSVFKGSYNFEEIERSGGRIEAGFVKFILMNNQVTGILSTDDMIYQAGTSDQSATTYQVKYFTNDPLHICYFIAGEAI